jgi:hypothetical protein
MIQTGGMASAFQSSPATVVARKAKRKGCNRHFFDDELRAGAKMIQQAPKTAQM